jgi:ubiquinone/menaquinone biosynthesis C-methylase UbiE
MSNTSGPRRHSRLRQLLTVFARKRPAATENGAEVSRTNGATEAPEGKPSADFVDVRRLMTELSVEELCETAEQYFACLTDWTHLLSKPLASVQEVPHVLTRFSTLLQGLRLGPNMTVLDFGAGPGWGSHYLAQLGCQVIVLDVSPTALRIANERFQRQPPFGNVPVPRFLVFDGHRIDLPDASVDRIFCHDTFHHVPNPEAVLREIARVLVSGGIAGFAEPGPDHSRNPTSQAEMRNFKVIENDIRIEEIWQQAQDAGFTDIRMAALYTPLYELSLPDFKQFLAGGEALQGYAQTVRNFMMQHRDFFLFKGPLALDSRTMEGLRAKLEVNLEPERQIRTDKSFQMTATIRNTGTARFRTQEGAVGSVHFGVHLYDAAGRQIAVDYARFPLRSGEARPVDAGESVTLSVTIPAPTPGQYTLGFDLVSEAVCWFAPDKSEEIKFPIDVLPS